MFLLSSINRRGSTTVHRLCGLWTKVKKSLDLNLNVCTRDRSSGALFDHVHWHTKIKANTLQSCLPPIRFKQLSHVLENSESRTHGSLPKYFRMVCEFLKLVKANCWKMGMTVSLCWIQRPWKELRTINVLVWPLLEQLFLSAIDTGNLDVAEVLACILCLCDVDLITRSVAYLDLKRNSLGRRAWTVWLEYIRKQQRHHRLHCRTMMSCWYLMKLISYVQHLLKVTAPLIDHLSEGRLETKDIYSTAYWSAFTCSWATITVPRHLLLGCGWLVRTCGHLRVM